MPDHSKKIIIITGGGTGGHVFPAIAIAQGLRSRGFEVLYVGSPHGLENKLVPPTGIPLYTVKSGQLKNQGALKKVKTLFQVCFAVLWAMKFILKHKPAAVIGVGGYVSAPICVAAFLLGRPVYLQEQNVSVGIANRLLGKISKTIFLGFEAARQHFPAKRCVYTGNPLRREFFEQMPMPYDPNSPHLLIFGGSQGAKTINDAVIARLTDLKQKFPNLKILHQTGESDCERVKAIYAEKFKDNFEVRPFISDMLAAYRQASFVVCRSGALTVSELICVSRPSLLVPFPRKGQNDQVDNAKMLEKAGCARMVEQGEGFHDRFWSALIETFQPATLSRMKESFSTLHPSDALVTIGAHIEKDVEKKAAIVTNVQ